MCIDKQKGNRMEQKNKQGQTLAEFLAAYDENKYRRPSVTVDMAVFTLLKTGKGETPSDYRLGVSLIQRGDHPNIGKWALPGGFVNFDEDLEHAAARELEEETGLRGLSMKQFGAFGAPDRDPRTRIITAGYYAIAPFGSLRPEAGDDAANARLFTVELKLRAQSARAEIHRLKLVSGEVFLQNDVKRVFDTMGAHGEHMPGGDLASDHGLLLFSALMALNDQPVLRAANLLAGNDAKLSRIAEGVLKALFENMRL